MVPDILNGFNTTKVSITRAHIKDHLNKMRDLFGNQWALNVNKKREKSTFTYVNTSGICVSSWSRNTKKDKKKKKWNLKLRKLNLKKMWGIINSACSVSLKKRSNLISMSDMEKTIYSVELFSLSEIIIVRWSGWKWN